MKMKLYLLTLSVLMLTINLCLAQTDKNNNQIAWSDCVDVYYEDKPTYCPKGQEGIKIKFKNKCKETLYVSVIYKLANGTTSKYGYSFLKSEVTASSESCRAISYEIKVCPKPEGGCK